MPYQARLGITRTDKTQQDRTRADQGIPDPERLALTIKAAHQARPGHDKTRPDMTRPDPEGLALTLKAVPGTSGHVKDHTRQDQTRQGKARPGKTGADN